MTDALDSPVPDEGPFDYDLVVVGSGPGGQRAAIAAAKLGTRSPSSTASAWSGASASTPAPSRQDTAGSRASTSPAAQRELYGASYQVKEDITIADLIARTQHVIARETEVVRAQLLRNHVELLRARRSSSTRTASSVRPGDGAVHHVARHRAEHRHRHRHPARPARRSSSTSAGSWTPTASSTWTTSPPRWSWSGRNHRHRVRVHVRRAGHPRDGRRKRPTMLDFWTARSSSR